MAAGSTGKTNSIRLAAFGLACAALAAAAAPALGGQYTDSTAMKGMTVLQCTGQGRWARGPMDAAETYAIDAAAGDVMVLDKASSTFASICAPGPGCDVAIDAASYSVSRQEGDHSYSLAISRANGGWSEDQRNAADRQDFTLKSGACKPIKNPLPKAPKAKF